jgi:acetyl-CoA carboxylase carboxyltransferase component
MKDPAHHQQKMQKKLIREARQRERSNRRMTEQRERLEQYADEEELIEWIPLREPMLRNPSHKVRPNK